MNWHNLEILMDTESEKKIKSEYSTALDNVFVHSPTPDLDDPPDVDSMDFVGGKECIG